MMSEDEVAELRSELAELDSELAEATFELQRQRAAFAEQVSRNDLERSQKAEEVKLALQQLEAERMRMDCFHQELEAESHIAQGLQATCRDLEQQLDLCDAGTSSAKQSEDDLAAREEELLASARVRLATAESEQMALAEAEKEAVAAQRATCPKAARLLLKAAMEDLAEEAEHMAQAVARRTERRLEAATCRLAAASASTRVVAVALARRAAARRVQVEPAARAAQPSSWDAELAGFLEALTEAEAVSRRQLELQQASVGRRNHLPGSAEVAALRHAIGHELKSGVFQGLAATLGIPNPQP
eukprot:TRINITY_DN51019_c0_g1_i1.p1 TRINITY_DN51019_c0_g1~~TRINITY_DN51019_c0_g1_i1.p1  ORF type:complete len:302 (-),score=91.40 TRINITY_DN51019_c0_g1_i1:17-922(-)